MKRSLSLLVILILIVSICAGCKKSESMEMIPLETATYTNEDVRIGLVVSTLLNPFFVELKDGAVDQADKAMLKLTVLDSRDDAEVERQHLSTLIESDVDAILLNTTDPNASKDIVERAVEKGIKVITIDRAVNSNRVSVHVASDNYTGGKLAGHFILEQLEGTGKVVHLLGLKGASVDAERGAGFEAVLDGSDVEVVAKERADFDRGKGEKIIEALLDEYEDLDAIFAHNDEMALGALKAVTRSNSSVVVVGFDGIDDAIIAVQDGSLGATIAQQPREIGVEGIRTALKLIDGQEVEETVLVPLKLITNLTNE